MRTITAGWNEPLIRASPLAAIRRFWSHYFEFSGRASLSEYWWWGLANLLIYVGLAGFLLHAVSPGSSIHVVTGPFGPGLGDELSAFQVGTATFADHPVATPAWLQIMIGTWTWLTLVPNISLMVRRLHDANFSGFWALLGLVPPGALVLVIMACRSSRQTSVRFDRPWRGSPAPRQRLAP